MPEETSPISYKARTQVKIRMRVVYDEGTAIIYAIYVIDIDLVRSLF
jgi:hypothetical protein